MAFWDNELRRWRAELGLWKRTARREWTQAGDVAVQIVNPKAMPARMEKRRVARIRAAIYGGPDHTRTIDPRTAPLGALPTLDLTRPQNVQKKPTSARPANQRSSPAQQRALLTINISHHAKPAVIKQSVQRRGAVKVTTRQRVDGWRRIFTKWGWRTVKDKPAQKGRKK
jgi:hypothetical protein